MSCTAADSIREFTSRNGARGFVFFLDGDRTVTPTGAVSAIRKGPFYVFAQKTGATASEVVLIHAPLAAAADEADADTIEEIAASLRLPAQE
jgi:hypothetical protein